MRRPFGRWATQFAIGYRRGCRRGSRDEESIIARSLAGGKRQSLRRRLRSIASRRNTARLAPFSIAIEPIGVAGSSMALSDRLTSLETPVIPPPFERLGRDLADSMWR